MSERISLAPVLSTHPDGPWFVGTMASDHADNHSPELWAEMAAKGIIFPIFEVRGRERRAAAKALQAEIQDILVGPFMSAIAHERRRCTAATGLGNDGPADDDHLICAAIGAISTKARGTHWQQHWASGHVQDAALLEMRNLLLTARSLERRRWLNEGDPH
jgi:hypothetical protein